MAESHQTAEQVLIEVGDRAYAERFNELFRQEGTIDFKEVRLEAMEAAIDAMFAEPELIDGVQGGW